MSRGDGHEFLSFTPNDHDVRIARDDWIYYVRGVKKGEPLRTDFSGDSSGIGELIASFLLAWLLASWWNRQTTWKVGVLRYPDTAWGGRIRIAHKELLPPGVQPAARIAELVEEVFRGRFDPS